MVFFDAGMLKEITLVLLIGLVAWGYRAMTPPPHKICGTPGGPPVTAPRVKLRDGRHLAYKEHGVPKEIAKYRVIYVHGFSSYRNHALLVTDLSPERALEFVEEVGLYLVTFDRPGYGESDPDPNRTPESLALDIEEFADQLGLGSKFYIIGFSMGGQVVWGCLKYIPHRLAGVALLAPAINFWWPGFPANLSKEAYYLQLPQDQWTYRISHYAPWLTYWWNTQKWFPASAVAAGLPEVFSLQDLEIISKGRRSRESQLHAIRQGEFESLHRDMIVGLGKWEFDPMDLKNPFPNNEGSVHLWQGNEDRIVPAILQRYISQRLPWIQYHELPGSGHLFPYIPAIGEAVFRSVLLGKQ